MADRKLRGRRREQEALEQLLRDVRAGQSRTLVLRGEAGCGKTALLDQLADRAGFATVLRTAGVESESEIAYSALQQVCAPLLPHLDALPEPQRVALGTAFGLTTGPAPERLLVGLAVLGLFAEASAGQPVVCLVDDVQWVDVMSAVILGFVARRLAAEAIALVFAARAGAFTEEPALPALPEMVVEGLADADARALLDSVLTGPVDPRVRDRIVAETRGNPLALLELPRGLSAAQLAFGFDGHASASPAGRVEEGYRQRISVLPAPTRRLLLAAAVEPVGDVILLRRALERLGVDPSAAAPAEQDGLIEIGTRVRFAHPLVRSAAWRSGPAGELRMVHAALAEVTDPVVDPDRRAWHRANAATGPDEQISAELEGSADRALSRGGRAAAASFLVRAAELTLDPKRRGMLLVGAASASAQAGVYERVPELLGAAEAGPLGPLQQARVEQLRAQVAFLLRHTEDASEPLLAAARRLETLDPVAARDTFLLALTAAIDAGRYGGDALRRTAEAARQGAPAGHEFADLLLRGLVAWVLDGRAAAVGWLNQALDDALAGPAVDVALTWLVVHVAYDLLRLDVAFAVSEQAVRSAREAGALSGLPGALTGWAIGLINAGRLAEAAELLEECDALTQGTRASVSRISHLVLAAYRGPERAALELIESARGEAVAGGNGRLATLGDVVLAIVHNGLGHPAAALDAVRASIVHDEIAVSRGALGELVEAAARAGAPQVARAARDQLAERTAVTPTPAGLGFQALADALAGPPAEAEPSYRAAIQELSRPETAIYGYRARLLFGEWLRRANRRAEARAELRTAYQAFAAMGAEIFAERARRELAATGETVRKRTLGENEELTSQEAAIAQLVITGRTNPEIGAALFLSPRTVEWHLRKIFTKLGIGSRREVAAALTGEHQGSRG
jgi:DNA-binding CsgD family transcriptional regulator